MTQPDAKRFEHMTKAELIAAVHAVLQEERTNCTVDSGLQRTASPAQSLSPAAAELNGRQLFEETARHPEDRLHSILNSIEEVVWSVSLDGAELYFISPAAEEIYGRPLREFYEHGQVWSEAVHPDDQGVVDQAFQVMAEQGRFDVEYRIVRPDGAVRWLHDRGHIVADLAGKPLRVDGVATDVTKRMEAQLSLQAREAQLASIIATAMDGIITIDVNERIVLFNEAAAQIFRCPAAEALGQPIEQFIPARYRPTHHQHIAGFGQTPHHHNRMAGTRLIMGLRADGEEFPMEASISMVVSNGQTFYTAIHRDVSESLHANERLIEQAALLDQSHEAIVVRSLDGRIHYWSRGAERLYGWTAEEVIGRPVQELLYKRIPEQFEEATRKTLERGEWSGELRHLNRQGREVIVEGHWSLVRDAEQRPKHILAINTDVTEKRKIEAQLLRAQRLESLGTLASGIAHDLNNVLSPILMGTQMLQMKLHDELCLRLVSVM